LQHPLANNTEALRGKPWRASILKKNIIRDQFVYSQQAKAFALASKFDNFPELYRLFLIIFS
jgi:hypothetical protein